jgi:hypothetical protein
MGMQPSTRAYDAMFRSLELEEYLRSVGVYSNLCALPQRVVQESLEVML